MALTTTATRSPADKRARTRPATARIRSTVATELPPYFCTISAIASPDLPDLPQVYRFLPSRGNKKAPSQGALVGSVALTYRGLKMPLKVRGRYVRSRIRPTTPLSYRIRSVGIGTWTAFGLVAGLHRAVSLHLS